MTVFVCKTQDSVSDLINITFCILIILLQTLNQTLDFVHVFKPYILRRRCYLDSRLSEVVHSEYGSESDTSSLSSKDKVPLVITNNFYVCLSLQVVQFSISPSISSSRGIYSNHTFGRELHIGKNLPLKIYNVSLTVFITR